MVEKKVGNSCGGKRKGACRHTLAPSLAPAMIRTEQRNNMGLAAATAVPMPTWPQHQQLLLPPMAHTFTIEVRSWHLPWWPAPRHGCSRRAALAP